MPFPSPSPENPAQSGHPEQEGPSPELGGQQAPEQGQQLPPWYGGSQPSAPGQQGRAPQTAHDTPYPFTEAPQQQYAQQPQPHAYPQAQYPYQPQTYLQPHAHPQAYGYPQAPIYYQQVPPRPMPVIDGKELRPRTRWYWIGGLTIPLGIVVGVIVFLLFFSSASAEPEFIAEFESGEQVTFEVGEGEEQYWGLYASGDVAGWECDLEAPTRFASQQRNLVYPEHSFRTSQGPGWKLDRALITEEPGEYTLSCDTEDGGTYGLGTLEQTANANSKMNAGGISLIAIGLLGFVAGLAIIITTSVRRGSHHARLARERMQAANAPQDPGPLGPGPQPDPPQGPGPQGPGPQGPGPQSGPPGGPGLQPAPLVGPPQGPGAQAAAEPQRELSLAGSTPGGTQY